MHRLALASLLTLLAVCVLAAPAAAEQGKIEIKARTEPAELQAGGDGTLVIEATLPDKLHVYATDLGGVIPTTFKPIEAEGVTYDLESATKTKSERYVEPTFKDEYDIWHDKFEIRIPIKLAASAKTGTKIGLLVTYQGCTDQMCWPPQKDQEAATTLKIVGGAVAKVEPAAGNGGGIKPKGGNPPVLGKPDGGPQMPLPLDNDDVMIAVTLSEDGKALIVTWTPGEGRKLYPVGAEMEGQPVTVEPVKDDGISWGTIEMPTGFQGTHEAIKARVPFERTTAETAELQVGWQVCLDSGTCLMPAQQRFIVRFEGKQPGDGPHGADKPKDTPTHKPVPPGAIVFPVVEGDKLDVQDENLIQSFYADYGLLVLGLIFLLGAGLAFTPCVLPIIPITVAVVTGGRSDLPRKRLLALLSTYVMSMALTFGLFGVIAASAGSTMSAAFQKPEVIWGIAGLFTLLAFGMLGVIELQPPQWMTKLQGGAQQRGGSLLGAALLGCVMAFVASPCTGPFIVAMSVVLATTESIALGFSMFFAMGLGMGAVLFAFGALNFALRPGPWMVWVRYGFGMLLFGGALYYVADPGLLKPPTLYVVAVVVSLFAAYLVARHLVKAEGEQPNVARGRGLRVAGMFLVAAALIAWITMPPSLPDNVDKDLVSFQKIKDVDHLKSLVADSVAESRPTVVDVWGTWCKYCKVYEAFIQRDPELRHEFSKLKRLKIDVSTDNRDDLRDALGIPRGTQPFFVFIDGEGNIRRAADVNQWYGTEKKSREAMLERLKLVLGDEYGLEQEGRPYRTAMK